MNKHRPGAIVVDTIVHNISLQATRRINNTKIDFCILLFFFNDTATTEIYTLSLHDALPISDTQDPGYVDP